MRRVLTISLLALVSCHFAGYWILPLAQLASTRAGRAQQLAKPLAAGETTTAFTISKKDFRESRFGRREIWHNGLVFDIVSATQRADSVQVVAISDAREQRLLAHMQVLFAPAEGSLPGSQNLLSKLLALFMAQPFLCPEPPLGLVAPDVFFQKNVFACLPLPSGCWLGVLSPPPKA